MTPKIHLSCLLFIVQNLFKAQVKYSRGIINFFLRHNLTALYCHLKFQHKNARHDVIRRDFLCSF